MTTTSQKRGVRRGNGSPTLTLNPEPHFASEAQETFTAGCRVYAVAKTVIVNEGAEGVYLGHLRERQALVGWDTPSGEPFSECVSFSKIKNLYR